MKLRTPKGTIDFDQNEAKILEMIIDRTKKIFSKYGALPIDTPIFELSEVLKRKYDDDDKLIFDLADQGGDICSLRYDLTVPFARYVAQNNIQKISRYQIGKVFRRDQPVLSRGRFREFYQCDFDIAGNYLPLISDCEILKIMAEILSAYKIGEFVIKINSRKLLIEILKLANITEENYFPICASIDKLDSKGKDYVIEEMGSKGLTEKQIEIIFKHINMRGKIDIIDKLKNSDLKGESFNKILKNLNLLFSYIRLYNIYDSVIFDCSLARGAAYYTDVIFEAEYIGLESYGSVAGGGRYDNLTTLFKNTMNIPAVGFSVGLYRILAIMKSKNIKAETAQIFIATIGEPFVEEKIRILTLLRSNDISCTSLFIKRVNFKEQIAYAQKLNIKNILFFGESELQENKIVLLKNNTRVEIMRNADFIENLRRKIK